MSHCCSDRETPGSKVLYIPVSRYRSHCTRVLAQYFPRCSCSKHQIAQLIVVQEPSILSTNPAQGNNVLQMVMYDTRLALILTILSIRDTRYYGQSLSPLFRKVDRCTAQRCSTLACQRFGLGPPILIFIPSSQH